MYKRQIKKGITLSTAISDNKFQGTATNADSLGNVAAANYLRSNANDTTTGTLTIANDGGAVIGTDSDFSITVDSGGTILANSTSDADITFKVNDGGATTTMMTMDASTSQIGIGTTTPTQKLDVVGTVKASAFIGGITGNVSGNVTSSGANTMGTLNLSGTLTGRSILPDADATYDIGASGSKYNTIFAKATSAQYADLAEIYESDADYGVGTVVVFGGEKEITISKEGNSTCLLYTSDAADES